MKKIMFVCALALAACTTVDGSGGTDPGPDGGGMQIDPPADSTTWACRSGVDAAGHDYMEFRPAYLNGGSMATAYIVGDAPGEGIVGYFNGSYVTESKDSGSSWYRYDLVGPDGSTFVLTYASCVDKQGTNADCWAQYGSGLSADVAGPFRWNSSGTSYACKGTRHVGQLATPAN